MQSYRNFGIIKIEGFLLLERIGFLKKLLHKLGAFLLVLIMFVSVLPPSAYAAAEATLIDTVYFQNASTKKYLSLKELFDSNKKPINSDIVGNTINTDSYGIDKVNIVIKVKKLSNNNFILQPAHSTENTIVFTGTQVKLGVNDGSVGTQWTFVAVGNGNYTIRPANNLQLALSVDSNGNAILQTYNATDLKQQWCASKFSVRKEEENPDILEYGIDVSRHQADINWKAVKEYGIDFAILNIGFSRTTELTTKDSKFEQNYAAAKEEGIKLGVYIYSYAVSVKEAQNDANTVLEYLDGRELELPIFYDIEDKSQYDLSVKLKTDMCVAFMKKIQEAGYETGVYANRYWYENHLDRAAIEAAGGDVWRAQYLRTDRASNDYVIPETPEIYSDVDIWQFREDGKVAGIVGNVDMNVSFKNYDQKSFTYTGAAITPTYRMYNEQGELMTEGVDYTVAYQNNINVGTATVVFTGINNYVGKFSATRQFRILPKSICTATITGATNSKRYTGAAVKPQKQIKVVLNGKKLKNGTDFTISYKNNKNIGTATLTIKGKGNYSGSRSFKFKIIKAKLSSATITGIKDKVYTGSARKLSLKVKLSGTTLKSGKDYTVSYKNNVDFGTATVTIKAKGSRVTGKVTKTFNIVPQTPKITSISKRGLKSLAITWSHSDYATKYQLYRATSENGKYKKVYTSPDRWTYTYKNKKLKEGTYYYYKVRAYKTVNGKKYYSAWSSIKKTNTKISDTTFTTKRNKKKGTVTINIEKDKSVSKYIVYVSTKQNSGFKKVWSGSELTYKHTGLKKGKTYYIRVRTYKKTANGGIYGTKTEPKKIKM